MENNSIYFTQAAIENAFKSSKERGNYFIEFNRNVILEETKTGKLVNTLEGIINVLQPDVNDDNPGTQLSIDDFTLIGAIAYFYGMDFTGQSYLHPEICENVHQRFKNYFDGYEFSDAEIRCIYHVFTLIREVNIRSAKDQMKEAIIDKCKLNKEDDVTLKTVIIPGLKSIVNGCIIPINLSKEVTELKQQKEITYQNISKYNLLINQNCDMCGKTIKAYCNVYSQPLYAQLLDECLIREEKGKFAVMYLDSILSMVEAIQRMSITEEELIQLTLFEKEHLAETIDFDAKREEFESKFEIEANEANADTQEVDPDASASSAAEGYTPKVSTEDMNMIFHTDPDLTIAAYLEEIARCNNLSNEIILTVFDKLLSTESAELLQHIYQYMGQKLKDPVTCSTLYPGINLSILIEQFDSLISDAQDEYRKIAEFICQPIPEDKINRVTTYVNDLISSLILTDTQQKQYLISQFMENSISTYNQLQQIISLIEQAKVFGADSSLYTNLYNYLIDNDNFTEVFEEAKKLAVIENKISLITKFKEWFSRYLPNELIEEPGVQNPPKMEILKK